MPAMEFKTKIAEVTDGYGGRVLFRVLVNNQDQIDRLQAAADETSNYYITVRPFSELDRVIASLDEVAAS
jgi:hypothetical protein